jgi:hypothetical protein
LRDSLSGGAPDYAFNFGFQGVIPVTGNWSSPLEAAELAAPGAEAAPITDADLIPIVQEATARWTDAGIDAGLLSSVDVIVADLSGNQLGLASGNRVVIDADAAGHGWFVDETPWDDVEFGAAGNGDLVAATGTSAASRMDLLTAVMHELGHVLGYSHESEGIMDDTLPLGTRRLLLEDLDWSLDGDGYAADAIDRAFASL